MTDREIDLHCARVYLAEAVRRRAMGQRGFAATLQAWAARCRLRAGRSVQREMFR